jgi:hypothetical protein
VKSGIWKVEVARLCWACQQEMAHEYIMQPTKEQRRDPVRDRWESGVCERCGRKQSMTKLRRYTMNRAGLVARGRENG